MLFYSLILSNLNLALMYFAHYLLNEISFFVNKILFYLLLDNFD